MISETVRYYIKWQEVKRIMAPKRTHDLFKIYVSDICRSKIEYSNVYKRTCAHCIYMYYKYAVIYARIEICLDMCVCQTYWNDIYLCKRLYNCKKWRHINKRSINISCLSTHKCNSHMHIHICIRVFTFKWYCMCVCVLHTLRNAHAPISIHICTHNYTLWL